MRPGLVSSGALQTNGELILSSITDRYEMASVRDHILRLALEAEATPSVDMGELTRINSQAYRDTRDSGEGADGARRRALATLRAHWKLGPNDLMSVGF